MQARRITAQDAAVSEAQRRLAARISLGDKEEQRLLDYCSKNLPKDRYVSPKLADFAVASNSTARLTIQYAKGPASDRWGEVERQTIHSHALGQLCDISGLDRRYMRKLDEDSDASWRRELLAVNLNTLFSRQTFINKKRKPAEFLHRSVGGELRAVLTQSYNRHMVSIAVLRPFLEVCRECDLHPAAATITDMRVHLQAYLPHVYQPVPGEFVALGACWGNSDFGQGKTRVSNSILRLSTGSSLVTDDAFSRTHIGSIIEDTDLRLSDDVAVKELAAVAAAIQSTVRAAMDPEQVEKVLQAITWAYEAQVPWSKLKVNLSKYLTKDDLTTMESLLTDGITELPPAGIGTDGNPLPSRWWAASALSYMAEKQTDATKAMDMRQLAGNMLDESKGNAKSE